MGGIDGTNFAKPVPLNSFKWFTKHLNYFIALSIPDILPVAYILEVDIEYTTSLHFHNNVSTFPV